jgi:hypothetical protein
VRVLGTAIHFRNILLGCSSAAPKIIFDSTCVPDGCDPSARQVILSKKRQLPLFD